jgi:thiosulfate/3-mercaptopyruvate sulfurtransferase
MLTKDDVIAALGTDTVLLDVRDVDEWTGESSSPYGKRLCAAQGPPARRQMDRVVPLHEAVGPGPGVQDRWKCRPNAPPPASRPPTRSTCTASRARVRPTPSWHSSRPASADVRMYFGSWNEWSRDDALPIESGLPVLAAKRPRWPWRPDTFLF